MPTVRARLTTAYGVAIGVTLIVFSLALLVARRASAYRELQERVQDQAAAVLEVVRQTESEGLPLTVRTDTTLGPVVTPQLSKKLQGVGDYVLVHSGFALERMDPDEARDALNLFADFTAGTHRAAPAEGAGP